MRTFLKKIPEKYLHLIMFLMVINGARSISKSFYYDYNASMVIASVVFNMATGLLLGCFLAFLVWVAEKAHVLTVPEYGHSLPRPRVLKMCWFGALAFGFLVLIAVAFSGL